MSKTAKKTVAPKTTRRKPEPKHIDPRLQRVFDVIDEAWEHNGDGASWEDFAALFLGVLIPTADGLKEMLTALLKNPCENEIGVGRALDKLRAWAEDEHRTFCTCCRARHEAQGEQSATVQ